MLSGNSHIADIGKLGIDTGIGCPAALFAEVGKPQFVDPNLTTLGLSIIGTASQRISFGIPHSNHDAPHRAQGWISANREISIRA
jgi:hypothetical protein